MAWNTPTLRYTGNIITAAQWNDDNYYNMRYLYGTDGTVTVNDSYIFEQAGDDDAIITLQSTGDVAHGATGVLPTVAFATFQKWDGDTGGLRVAAARESGGQNAYTVHALLGDNANTTKSASGRAIIEFLGSQITGTTYGNVIADGNILAIRARVGGADTSLWLVDEDGDTWQAGGITSTTGTFTGAVSTTGLTVTGSTVINSNGDYIQTPNTDNWWFQFRARDNGVGMVTVGRVSSGADPCFGLGGASGTTFRFYNSGYAVLTGRVSVIGGATSYGRYRTYWTGAWTSDGGTDTAAMLYMDGILTGAAGDWYLTGQFWANDIITQSAGNSIGVACQALFYAPTITIGTDTVTTAATIYIADAPSEGIRNASLYIGAGNIMLGDTVAIDTRPTVNDYYQLTSYNTNDAARKMVLRIQNSTVAGEHGIIKWGGPFAQAETASPVANAAAYGQWWVKSDTPCQPMFTDDTDADMELRGNVDTEVDVNVASDGLSGGNTYNYYKADDAEYHGSVYVEILGDGDNDPDITYDVIVDGATMFSEQANVAKKMCIQFNHSIWVKTTNAAGEGSLSRSGAIVAGNHGSP